ncbi:MAG: 4Fe-4S dicluster domain-containing protein [Deltaproteobacteria bacterium]|nr:MAG: 4Fe-4S dicluster domain-containing protein [Deltaproteobacteria bacterium]
MQPAPDSRTLLLERNPPMDEPGDHDPRNGLPPMTRKEVFQLGAQRVSDALRLAGGLAAERVLDRLGPHVQRPPGALEEIDFLLACTRCGQCVEACPAAAILNLGPEAGLAAGTPFLDPNRYRPCVACEDAPCMPACPTGALEVMSIADTVMGLAVLDTETCYAWQGSICRLCSRACPYPDEAIVLDEEGRPWIDPRSCIGCGRCVAACPTTPVSLHVEPAPRAS